MLAKTPLEKHPEGLSCQTISFFIHYFDQHGIHSDRYLSGIKFSKKFLLDPENKVPWNTFVTLLENVGSDFTEQELSEMGAKWALEEYFEPYFGGSRWASRWVFDARDVYDKLCQRALERKEPFSFVGAYITQAQNGAIQMELFLQPGFQKSDKFCLFNVGLLQVAPTIVGLSEAQVNMTYTPTGALYDIQFMNSRRRLASLRRRFWSGSNSKLSRKMANELLSRRERLIKSAHQKLEQISGLSHDYLMLINRKGEITFMNRDFEGKQIQEGAVLLPEEIFQKEAIQNLEIKLANVFQNGQVQNCNAEFCLSGQSRWLRCKLGPIWEEGAIVEAALFMTDVTAEIEKQQQLADREEMFRCITEQSHLGLVLLQNKRIQYVNDIAAEMLGFDRKEIQHWDESHFLSFFINDEGQGDLDIKTGFGTEAEAVPSQTYELKKNNEDTIWLKVSSRQINYRGEVASYVTLLDVTSEVNSTQELVESRQKKSAILHAIPDQIVIVDRLGTVINCPVVKENNLFFLTGIKEPHNLLDALPNGFVTKVKSLLKEVGGSVKPLSLSVDIHITGVQHHFLMRFVAYNADEILVISSNVTDSIVAEEELIKRNFELDSFVYRTSHDLKSPLNSIMGLIHLIKEEELTPNTEQYINLVDRSVKKLESFILDLTDFSRNQRMETQPEKIDFKSLLEESVENLYFMDNADRIKLETHLNCDTDFYSDSRRILIVFNNLISNAVKYQDLTKEVSCVKVLVSTDRQAAQIVISDNGIGIPETYQKSIFKMFFRATARSYGTGLGLYIVQQAIEKLGGTIGFESEEGKGTSFTVTLPSMERKRKELEKIAVMNN